MLWLESHTTGVLLLSKGQPYSAKDDFHTHSALYSEMDNRDSTWRVEAKLTGIADIEGCGSCHLCMVHTAEQEITLTPS